MRLWRRLAALDQRQSQIVELRFFGGLTVEETAEVLGVFPNHRQARLVAGADVAVSANSEASPHHDAGAMDSGPGTVQPDDRAAAERTHGPSSLSIARRTRVVRLEVESLLAAHPQADGFLSGSPFSELWAREPVRCWRPGSRLEQSSR